MYYQPKVIYENPEQERKNSVIRYLGNRVLRYNKNFIAALVGQTGSGKSWACLSIAEAYSKMYGIPFDPNIHVFFSLKEMLELVTSDKSLKKIRVGSILVFDEPQIEANSRNWRADNNIILNQLVSTFRNQRLIVLFATPYLEFIDKQSRILFHGEFKVLGYDRDTKITRVKPRFLEYNKRSDDFYRKRLIVEYSIKDKPVRNNYKLNLWNLDKPSDYIVEVYEKKKAEFTRKLNLSLLNSINLKEKESEGKNKSDELLTIKGYYEKYGEDYLKINEKMPHLSAFAIEKYIQFIKRSLKERDKRKTLT